LNQQPEFGPPPGYPVPIYQPGFAPNVFAGPSQTADSAPLPAAPSVQSVAVTHDADEAAKGKKQSVVGSVLLRHMRRRIARLSTIVWYVTPGLIPLADVLLSSSQSHLHFFTGTGNIDTLNLHLPDNVY
jgi:hypothetical protein